MYIDLLLLFLTAIFAILGFVHGFVRQILSLLLILSVIFFVHPLSNWIQSHWGWIWFSKAPPLVAWGIVGLVFVALFMAAHGIIAMIQKDKILEPIDRWIGAALGLVKGLVISLILCLIFQILPEKQREHFASIHRDSQSSFFMQVSGYAMEWKWHPTFEKLQEIRNEISSGREFPTAHRLSFEEEDDRVVQRKIDLKEFAAVGPAKKTAPTDSKRTNPWNKSIGTENE